MLDQLTHHDFTPHLHSTFTIHTSEDMFFEAQLIGVDVIGEKSSQPSREAFSLLFHVNNIEHIFFPQRMYGVHHSQMGRMDLFLVPLGPDQDKTGFRYEAVFT